jgi:hypothetical protein
MAIEPIITRVAHTGTDELRFRGHRVFAERLGKSSVAQMLILGIDGKLLEGEDIAVIDDIVTAMSSADPRMWPFKITRLASSHGVAAYGVAAAIVAAEGGMFGPNRMRKSAQWLVELHAHVGDAPTDDELASYLNRGAEGFGVLYRSRDERFEALMEQSVRRLRHELRYTRLCRHAVNVGRTRNLEPHVFLGVSAMCLDLGLSIDAIAALATILLFHDGLANAVEGAAQMPTVLRTLPRDVLDYRGPSARLSPRAAAQRD